MDFSVIFQLRTKKFWWMDVIFYFVISLLIATVLCYVIFLIKDSMIRQQISEVNASLKLEGTDSQKQQEKYVIDYRNKINDFTELIKNHQFASNMFAFVQSQTMPNIWFNQFSLDEKNSGVQLSGESDDMDAFSRQVDVLEGNKYVKNIGTLNSSLGRAARVEFNLNLALDKSIFSYLSVAALNPAPATSSEQLSSSPSPSPSPTPSPSPNGQENPPQQGTPSSEKLITSFRLLNPEILGQLDETNYTVTLNVPYGTDVKNLTPEIITSPGAVVAPASNILQDFTNPVNYTVTAQDGSAQIYKATVIVAPPPKVVKKSNPWGLIILIIVILIVVAGAFVGGFFIYKKKFIKSNKI